MDLWPLCQYAGSLVPARGVFLVVTRAIFSCSTGTLSSDMQDLVPWPGIEPGPPALGVWSQPLDHLGSHLFSALIQYLFSPSLTSFVQGSLAVRHFSCLRCIWDFPGGSDGRESTCHAGDLGSIPGSGNWLAWAVLRGKGTQESLHGASLAGS